MDSLLMMTKPRLVDLIREHMGPGNARRAIDNGTVRVLGKFVGKCSGVTWFVIRIVDYPKGRRRLTILAAGEFFTDNRRRSVAGKIDRVDWSHWYGIGAAGIDIDAAVLKRLTDKHHTEEHHAAQESAMQ